MQPPPPPPPVVSAYAPQPPHPQQASAVSQSSAAAAGHQANGPGGAASAQHPLQMQQQHPQQHQQHPPQQHQIQIQIQQHPQKQEPHVLKPPPQMSQQQPPQQQQQTAPGVSANAIAANSAAAMHLQQQQQHPHAQQSVPLSRLPDIMEALRQEVDHVAHELSVYKAQRDDYELKLNAQVSELVAFQQNLYELERANLSMKQQYEEEIIRLRKELEASNSARGGHDLGSGNASSGSGYNGPPQPQNHGQASHHGGGKSSGTPVLPPSLNDRGPQPQPPYTSMGPSQQQQQGQGDPQHPSKRMRGDDGPNGFRELPLQQSLPALGPGPYGPGQAPPPPVTQQQHSGHEGYRQDGPHHYNQSQRGPHPPPPLQQQGSGPQQYPPQPYGASQQVQYSQAPPNLQQPHPGYQQQPQSGAPPYGSLPPPHHHGQQAQQPPPHYPPQHQQPMLPHHQQVNMQPQQQQQSHFPPQQHSQQGAVQAPPHQQPPHMQIQQNQQPVTAVCDLTDPQVPAWRVEGHDWAAVFNPRSSLAQSGLKLRLDMLQSLDHGSVVCCIRFSPDGRLLATGSNRKAQVFDVKTGSCLHTLETIPLNPDGTLSQDPAEQSADLYVRSVCFSPDGRFLATGAEDNVVRLFDISMNPSDTSSAAAAGVTITPQGFLVHSRPHTVLRGHQQDIYSLDWSRDGRTIVSGSGDRSIRVWDAEQGLLVMAMNNEEDSAVGKEGGGLKDDGMARDAGVTSVAINPIDSKCVATGSLDNVVRLWDLRTGRLLERFIGHRDSVYSVSFSPDGRAIVSGCLDRTLKVWDISNTTLATLSRPPPPPPPQGVDPAAHYAHHGYQPVITTALCRHTCAGHRDYVLSVASAGGGAGGRPWVEPVLPFGPSSASANSTPPPSDSSPATRAILSDIEWVVSGSKDRTVCFWDGRALSSSSPTDLSRPSILMLQGHKNSVISVALAPHSGLFATGSGDLKVRIWRLSAVDHRSVAAPPQQQHHNISNGAASGPAAFTPPPQVQTNSNPQQPPPPQPHQQQQPTGPQVSPSNSQAPQLPLNQRQQTPQPTQATTPLSQTAPDADQPHSQKQNGVGTSGAVVDSRVEVNEDPEPESKKVEEVPEQEAGEIVEEGMIEG